jgi:hypothetical protein
MEILCKNIDFVGNVGRIIRIMKGMEITTPAEPEGGCRRWDF